MDVERSEILPGIWLNHLQTDKFKTACISISLLTQLQRETASMNALIPMVLRRGTAQYGDMEQLSARLDELYGTAIEPVVRRIGEIQCLGFFGSIPEEDFLPGKAEVLRPACELICQLLLCPNTRGGLLLPQYVDSEREKLLDIIRGRINEKTSYSIQRCIEEMCCYEDFAVSRFGSEEEAGGIRYQALTKQYRQLLQECPVEIFYCGRASAAELAPILTDALSAMPRGEINYDIGTDVRMNSVEDKPREVTEELDVSQGKLVIGFRLGECMEEADRAKLYVFNSVFGGGLTSKLFTTVREKLSLCYTASSMLDTHKGLCIAISGIDFDKFEQTRDEILRQLELIRAGEINDEELASAKAGIASDLRSTMDSQGDLEGFYLAQAIDGLDYGPTELAELAEDVSAEDVAEIAKSMECDMIYFLKGNGEDVEESEDE